MASYFAGTPSRGSLLGGLSKAVGAASSVASSVSDRASKLAGATTAMARESLSAALEQATDEYDDDVDNGQPMASLESAPKDEVEALRKQLADLQARLLSDERSSLGG